MSRPSKPRFDGFVFAAIWLVAAAFLSIAMWRFGHRQMGGFDHSALVDTAWRMVSSQRPYDEFYLTTPIGFYMGAGLAFRMWGARWSALVMMSIIYALFSFLVLTLLMRSYAPPFVSIRRRPGDLAVDDPVSRPVVPAV